MGITVLSLLALVGAVAAQDGNTTSTCTPLNNACSLYTSTCCNNQLCSMSPQCTTTALGTQRCLPVCEPPMARTIRQVQIGNYTAWEGGRRSAPAVLVFQEWWGVNEAIKETAEHIGAQGYRVLIPDIYQGRVALSVAEALHLSRNLNWTLAIQQMVQAVDWLLATGSPRVVATGFCQGGGLALCAGQFANVTAVVPFYGLPPAAFCQPERVAVPIQYHLGTNDTSFPLPRVEAAFAAINATGITPFAELFLYPNTGHAFMNGLTPAGRNLTANLPQEAVVTTAFARMTAFLAQYLRV